MSKVSTALYTLSFFYFAFATFNLVNPFCLFRLQPTVNLSKATGLSIGPRSRAHEIAMALKMYMLALVYLWGARRQVRGVRTCAFLGMIIYAAGALLTCLVKPELEGGVILFITGTLYIVFTTSMLVYDKDTVHDARELIAVELCCCKEESKKQ